MATFEDTALITAAVRYNTEALPLKHIPCELRGLQFNESLDKKKKKKMFTLICVVLIYSPAFSMGSG